MKIGDVMERVFVLELFDCEPLRTPQVDDWCRFGCSCCCVVCRGSLWSRSFPLDRAFRLFCQLLGLLRSCVAAIVLEDGMARTPSAFDESASSWMVKSRSSVVFLM